MTGNTTTADARTYFRQDAGTQWVEAHNNALASEDGKWVPDPEVPDVYGFDINGDIAIVVYMASPTGWGPDFECADWFDDAAHAGAPYPWEAS